MLHNAGHTCIDGASVLQRPISQFQQRTWLIDQQRHIGRSMDENTTADEAFQPLLPPLSSRRRGPCHCRRRAPWRRPPRPSSHPKTMRTRNPRVKSNRVISTNNLLNKLDHVSSAQSPT